MTNSDDISVPTVSAEEEPYIWTDGARSIALEDNDDTPEEDASVEQIGSDTQGHRRKRRRIQLQDQDTAAISYTHEICALSDNSADEDEDGLESHLERDLRNIAAQREQTIATIDAGESEENTDGEDIAYVGESVRKTISVDEEAKLQQVVEISNDEEEREKEGSKESTGVIEHKKAVEYRCPICFDPPEAALMTPCGHIFCTVCLFQMVNSSRGYRRNGQCALCRKDVKLKEVGLVILRKKRIKKES